MLTIEEHLQAKGHETKEIRSLLENGKVFLRGLPVGDGRRTADIADIVVKPNAPRLKPGRDPVLLHTDDEFVVVYKPSRFLSVRASHRHEDKNMMGFVYNLFGAAFPVHRLDEGTSGLMLVALTEGTQQILKDALERREIARRYFAIGSGYFIKARTVDSILQRNRGDGKRGSVAAKTKPERMQHKKQPPKPTETISADIGKRAVSHFTPIEQLQGASLIECQLETGRTHQIRIHLSELGHPVLGDDLYSSVRVAERSRRLALHAYSLTLEHPQSKEQMQFEIPLPDDMEKMRRTLAFTMKK